MGNEADVFDKAGIFDDGSGVGVFGVGNEAGVFDVTGIFDDGSDVGVFEVDVFDCDEPVVATAFLSLSVSTREGGGGGGRSVVECFEELHERARKRV